MSATHLHALIDSLPENPKNEVKDFTEFLLMKSKAKKIKKNREFGAFKGKIWMSDDFDEPLEDFKDYI